MKTPVALALVLLVAACAGSPAPEPAPEAAPLLPLALTAEEIHHKGEEAGIHNLAEVAPGLLRGAQPEGEKSFALLASLGVKTVLSVDGATPDAAMAAKYGIRYVHVPIEYSGITREEQARIVKAALDIPGPMYVHCHHGKHRGPAASGIVMMARGCGTTADAIADMKKAGADPKYSGLYADVGAFQLPSAEALAAVKPEDIGPSARVADLVASMIRVDGTFDRMKAVRRAGWKTPAAMPDVQPAHEARILAERFREIGRMDEAKGKPSDFQAWLGDSEKSAWDMEKALAEGDGAAAGAAMDRVGAACNVCHDAYRNTRRK